MLTIDYQILTIFDLSTENANHESFSIPYRPNPTRR